MILKLSFFPIFSLIPSYYGPFKIFLVETSLGKKLCRIFAKHENFEVIIWYHIKRPQKKFPYFLL